MSAWPFERIETDAELGDVGAVRLRELKTKRDEVVRALAMLPPRHTVRPYLYKAETIQRFQNRLREAFLSGRSASESPSSCEQGVSPG